MWGWRKNEQQNNIMFTLYNGFIYRFKKKSELAAFTLENDSDVMRQQN